MTATPEMQLRIENLRTYVKRLAHFAERHREFCSYCPKVQDCWNNNSRNTNPFSKGRCENTLRRYLAVTVREIDRKSEAETA